MSATWLNCSPQGRRPNCVGVRCAQETFLDLMLPVVSATIRHFELQQEQTSGLHPRVRKALRRRERLKARPRVEGESDAVFKVCASLCLTASSKLIRSQQTRRLTRFDDQMTICRPLAAGVHHA